MDITTAGILMVAFLGVLLLIGTPIGLALAISGISGLAMTRGFMPLEFLLSTFTYSYTANLSYIVLPLFLFMGHMAFVSGISEKAFAAAEKLIGHISGGLAIATVFGCAAFAMVCGSSVATASTMGRVAMPEMLKRGYAPRLAAGCVAAGGTLGVLIPPSGILVIYAIVTQASLVDLLLAAILPGLVTAAIYAVGIWGITQWKPELAPRAERREKLGLNGTLGVIFSSWEVMLLFAVVMGTIYLGIATPTESAAVGALIALLIAARSSKNRKQLLAEGLRETGSATAAIFLLIIGAGLFSLGLSTTQIPTRFAAWMVSFTDNRLLLLLILLVPYIILGMFVDGISMILLTMPIVYPVIKQAGIDPIWFGIIVTKTVEIGCLTPPVGLNAFVVKNVAPSIPLGEIFRGCGFFILLEIIVIGILIVFPEITTVLRTSI
ncbi:TRAP transporter large permease [Ferrovibrio sp.]|uniref:TRAP transporter large permease n=1 Tax=Ferrovibrio sp. TaxID=1917215 RepID=UPI003D09D8FA